MGHGDDQEVRTEDATEQQQQATEAGAEPDAAEAPAAARSRTPTTTAEPAEPTPGEPKEAPGVARPDRADALNEDRVALVVAESRERYGGRWKDVQTGFVDEPRQAVQQADQLVAEVIEHLAQSFGDERARLEQKWSRSDLDTEQLRVALQGYRTLLGVLLMD
jgi:hypothetical protein